MHEGNSAYRAEIARWRAEMEERLRADDGWLTVAGLFWLREGENSVGASPACDVALPSGAAPDRVGSFALRGGEVTFRAEPGAGALVNGEPADERALRPDLGGRPDLVTVRDLTMFVIQRGERVGIRLRDKNSLARRAFQGRRWYTVDESYRVEARFTPFDPPRPVTIANILGDAEERHSPGFVTFALLGEERTLVASPSSGGQLTFMFSDGTSGATTYPVGRFLTAPAPEGGRTVLDFNRAYSPPCAFTDFATCPIPLPENRMTVAVEAGELYAGHVG